MAQQYKTAAAFRQALEQRLKTAAASRGVPLNTLRLNVTIERLLARLFSSASPPWLLKGGYAMELRYRPHARTTTDIDLSVPSPGRIEQVREALQAAASQELDDFFTFRIAAESSELQGAPEGGARFPVEALVAGRRFAQFHVDVGIGDAMGGGPEVLRGDDLLEFAGVGAPSVLAVPRAQQFAEKLHALTFPWTDRPNTRTKDLVDLVLLMERGELTAAEVRDAVRRTFETRRTHPPPQEIPMPPAAWSKEFGAMAEEANLTVRDVSAAHRRLTEFWTLVQPG